MALDPTRSYRLYHLLDLIADYGANTTLQGAYNQLQADITAAAPTVCPHCAGKGRYDLQNDTGLSSDAGVIIEPDPICDGWGSLVSGPTFIYGQQFTGQVKI